MPEPARLRVYGHGKIEVELAVACLADLKHAYDSLFVIVRELDENSRRDTWSYSRLPPIIARHVLEPPTPGYLASFVPPTEHFLLNAVQLNSPGFWEFLGNLNALEILRKYLNDRHERRKDRAYRETAEQRRLALDNLALENKILAERINIARRLGATNSDLAPILNRLVYSPLSALDQYQDKGVIDGAELLSLSDERH